MCKVTLHETPASDSRSTGNSCWLHHHLVELSVCRALATVGAPRRDRRLLRCRLTATSCPMARLAARRTLGRARVTRLDALGLRNSCLRRLFSSHDASEHLTQLRAAKGKYLEGPCSLGRSRRVSGRLSALRIRMTITYSPHPPLKVCLHQISRATNNYHKHHGVENDNANTGGTVERDGGRASRHCRAR